MEHVTATRERLAAALRVDTEGVQEPGEAELEILRRSVSPWAGILIVAVTVSVLASGSGIATYVALCGISIFLLHVFRLPAWVRVVLLLVAIGSVVPSMVDALAEGEPGVGPLYGIVVFSLVFHTRSLNLIVVSATLIIVSGGAYEAWTTASEGRQAFGFLLLVPSALVFAFSYSWRRSVLSERERARLGERLRQQNRTLRRAVDILDQLGAAEERDRIAREIHDRLGHNLTSIHVYVEAAQRQLEPQQHIAQQALEGALQATSLGLREVRECVQHLRESNDALPLTERCRRTIERFPLRDSVDLQVSDSAIDATPQVQEVLLRCLQEGLTNIARHSNATLIVVEVVRDASSLRLEIQDNGVGCESIREGFGLLGMRERVFALGGDVSLVSSPNKGFRVSVSFPS